eukprot:5645325-Pyramimonas_sp.AAC.1
MPFSRCSVSLLSWRCLCYAQELPFAELTSGARRSGGAWGPNPGTLAAVAQRATLGKPRSK